MTPKSPLKWFAVTVGGIVAFAHIGVLGHLIRSSDSLRHPIVNLPQGRYSSYQVDVNKDGYSIRYRADDPKVLSSEKNLDLDKTKRGLFGGGSEKRIEYRRDEYTAGGNRNIGGAINGEGKSAEDIECIVADAGARSQGAMAGTAISAG